MGEIGNFILIGGAVLLGVLLLAIGVKLWELWRAQSWLPVTGTVVTSKVESREVRGANNTVRQGNFPKVVYRYKVGGHEYRHDRVSIGAQMPDVDVEQTLARYPVGATVTVYHDPAKPQRAVLERELPPGIGKGLVGVLIFFGVFVIGAFLYFTRGVDWLARRLPEGGNAPVAAILFGVGVLAALIGLAKRRSAGAAADWPQTTATIVSAEVVESLEADHQANRALRRSMYAPLIVYRYEVNGHRYESSRLHLGGEVRVRHEWMARRALRAYAPGMTVVAYVNPANPAEAVLDPRARHLWVVWLIAAACIGGALLMAAPGLAS